MPEHPTCNKIELTFVAAGLQPCVGHGLKAMLAPVDPRIHVEVQEQVSRLPETIRSLRPHAVIVDTDGPFETILNELVTLRDELPDTYLIILYSRLDQTAIPRLVELAPRAFLSKLLDAVELASSLRLIARGHMVLGSEILEHLVPRCLPASPPALDETEQTLLRHVIEGRHNDDIARLMLISRSSVKRHMEQLLTKLGVSNRLQAAVLAVKGEFI